MMRGMALLAIAWLGLPLGVWAEPATSRWQSGEIIDLTHPFGADTVYWPTEEGFVLERERAGITEGGFYYAANRFRGAEHGGTHLDAPVHFAEGRPTVDAIPLERLVGPGVLVDVSRGGSGAPLRAIAILDDSRPRGRTEPCPTC